MTAVINEADHKCNSDDYGRLSKFFGLSGPNERIIVITMAIFDIGWPAFKGK